MAPVFRSPTLVTTTTVHTVTDVQVAAAQLAELLGADSGWLVLTGAGCSTLSGIPAYRDAAGTWQHSPPMTYQAFMDTHAARQRYWARSLRGYPAMHRAEPNAAHNALRQLEHTGHVSGVVTQNVDSLHQKAGTRLVIALHGSLSEVRCVACQAGYSRQVFQAQLLEQNPSISLAPWLNAPDGDAAIEGDFSDFIVPACSACGGILKPNVVFYGEGVPRAVVEQAYAALASSRGLLVVGSSLTVFSGYRLVRAAHRDGLPVVIVNQGLTRGDALARLKLDVDCGSLLPMTAAHLTA